MTTKFNSHMLRELCSTTTSDNTSMTCIVLFGFKHECASIEQVFHPQHFITRLLDKNEHDIKTRNCFDTT
jgi:hypothetical protein